MSLPDADTDALRRFLESSGACCPDCRYTLQGFTGRTCPECGLHLVLQLRGDPWVRRWSWLPLLAMVLTGLSACADVLLGVRMVLVVRTAAAWPLGFRVTQILGMIVSGLVLVVCLVGARSAWRNRHMPLPTSWRNPFVLCAGLLAARAAYQFAMLLFWNMVR